MGSMTRQPAVQGWRARGEYEYRVLTLDRSTRVNDARRLLTEEAEYGRWELDRHIRYADGRRTIWLRRRIIRAVRTA